MTDCQLAEMYMVLGGIPYYWKYLDRSLSPAQNIHEIFFSGSDKLENEFQELYSSLFRKKEAYMRIVSALGSKRYGMDRGEISASAKVANSGTLTQYLQALEQCGFIRKYVLPGRKRKGALYQLIDNFTLFHFRFLDGESSDENFWQLTALSPSRAAWRGLAFERLCLQHVRQIRAALGIAGIHVEAYAWSHSPDDVWPEDAQIDLLLDRSDGIVNVCEMKFCSDVFAIDAATEAALMRKLAVFAGVTRTRKAVHLTMVTTFGLLRNAHSGRVQSEVTLDDLFK